VKAAQREGNQTHESNPCFTATVGPDVLAYEDVSTSVRPGRGDGSRVPQPGDRRPTSSIIIPAHRRLCAASPALHPRQGGGRRGPRGRRRASLDFAPGDRVRLVSRRSAPMPRSALCRRNFPRSPARRPSTSRTAAAAMLKGPDSAIFAAPHVPRPRRGHTILVHAAGPAAVGLILTQWAKHLGATVIGTGLGSDREKAELAHQERLRRLVID